MYGKEVAATATVGLSQESAGMWQLSRGNTNPLRPSKSVMCSNG